jgi:hypothetical protein
MFNVNFDVELKRKGLNIHLAVYKSLKLYAEKGDIRRILLAEWLAASEELEG